MQKAIMDRVFVKLDEPVKKAILIDEEPSKTKSGIVQSIGEQVTEVKVGDHIIFHDWDVEALNGLVAIREKWVLGVITDE